MVIFWNYCQSCRVGNTVLDTATHSVCLIGVSNPLRGDNSWSINQAPILFEIKYSSLLTCFPLHDLRLILQPHWHLVWLTKLTSMEVSLHINSSSPSVQVATVIGTGTISVAWGKHFSEDKPPQCPEKIGVS